MVIAIISVLASMLLPALSQAREMARLTKCQSNLKQVGTATMMYADDANGYIAGNNYADAWSTGLEVTASFTAKQGYNPNLNYLTIWGGYIPGFSVPGATSHKVVLTQQPVTTCPSFWTSGATEYWRASDDQTAQWAVKAGGTYGFNRHFDRTLCTSITANEEQKLDNIRRLADRFLYTDTTSYKSQVNTTLYASSGDGLESVWWGHQNRGNFLMGDGRVAQYSLSGFFLSTGRPGIQSSHTWGDDTKLPSPW